MLSFLKNLFGKKAETAVAEAPYKVENTTEAAVAISLAPEVAPAMFLPVAGLMVKGTDEAAVAPARTPAARGPAAPKAKAPAKPKAPRAPKKKAV